MCLCGFDRLNFRNGTAKSSINTGRYTVDYLLCGDLPYPAWKKRVSAQDLRNRRIRRYFVCRLKRPEARDFSHVRFTRKYGNRLETIEHIMNTLGAAQVHMADKGYELEIFENLYLKFLFWEGDEAFPASSQILFSSNFPAAFDAYDLAEVGEICINAFSEIAKSL